VICFRQCASATPAAGFPIRLTSTAAAAPIVDELESLDDLEGELVKAAVSRGDGDLGAASRLPGITRPQLAYRLKKYDKGKYQDVRLVSVQPDSNARPAR
jgi:DNA-binding NtrC family response regulator